MVIDDLENIIYVYFPESDKSIMSVPSQKTEQQELK